MTTTRGSLTRLSPVAWAVGAVMLAGFLLSAHPVAAQTCLGAPIERHAIAARMEQGAGDTWFLGGDYTRVVSPVTWGVHAGAMVEGFPPENPQPAGGVSLVLTGPSQRFCPAASVTWWHYEIEGFPEDGRALSVGRIGLGIGTGGGNERVTLVAYAYPHLMVRTGSEDEGGFALDLGGGIGGGRFWASGGVRFDAARPGQDVPDAALLFRGGVRF